VCRLAEALAGSVDAHLAEWDGQIATGLNKTMNCSMFLEYVYLSRDRIRMELAYIRGNFSEEEQAFQAKGEQGPTTWVMSHMSTAASLISAHLHIHGVLAAARPYCLSENLQLLFLMSLRELKGLLVGQLQHIWVMYQGASDWFRQGSRKWLSRSVELFEADLRTMETIMVAWDPPADEEALAAGEPPKNNSRPGPPLPPFTAREEGGAGLSTVEVLRRDIFEDWDTHKPLVRALMRHVLPRDGHVIDLCAGRGQVAEFLNDTGLITAYAFDHSSNIKLLTRDVVQPLRSFYDAVELWRTFDVAMCLSAAEDLGSQGSPKILLENVAKLAANGAILGCSNYRATLVEAAAAHAPSLKLDEQLSDLLQSASGEEVCVFWKRG